MEVTRLAPSPTGALHLGNARTFLINWLLARQNGWRLLLRIEDIDSPRVKKGADRQVIDDLLWLGLDWDGPPVYQSSRLETYRQALGSLLSRGAAYPCTCSRKEVELAASAPHLEDGSTIYPGTCRGKYADMDQARREGGRQPAVRFIASDELTSFVDHFAGERSYLPSRDLGDFVIAKADGTPAYQLAVVVDDVAAGVTQVVRGDDLLDSTPRQIAIYRALGMTHQVPTYCHLPLVVGTDGRRLAKRHGDTRLDHYRRQGVPAGRVRALLARWLGMDTDGELISVKELMAGFRLSHLPHKPIVFTADDDRWLTRHQG